MAIAVENYRTQFFSKFEIKVSNLTSVAVNNKYIICFLGLILFLQTSYAQKAQLEGIVNKYSSVNNIKKGICNDTISVYTLFSLDKNDKMLIIQMQGASINKTNTSSFGQIKSLNNAGNFEIVTFDTLVNNRIVTKHPLQNQYDVSGKVQLIKIATYQNAVVTKNLAALAWNGIIGGVLAIEIKDTLELDSNITADALGFRGGQSNLTLYTITSSSCDVTDYFNPIGNMKGGEKGEGIAIRETTYQCGRGSIANGGGGGNSHNSGGGGGANFGTGGLGGKQYVNCGNLIVGGLGGKSNVYSSTTKKILLGGGGGGGEANGNLGSDGGNGGGLIIISAGFLKSNGNVISSKGEAAATATADGAGGGGGGGTILLDIKNYLDTAKIYTTGGHGGNNNNRGSCVGPGGGGGGGLIWYKENILPPLVKTYVNGGASGKFTNSNQSACYNTSYGATAGKKGGLLNKFEIKNFIKSESFLGNDTTFCPNETLILNASSPNATYRWQDNSTDSTFVVSQAGTYWVKVSSNSCSIVDSIVVTYQNSIDVNLGTDTTLCPNETLFLNAYVPNATYRWQDNSTDSVYLVTHNGIYWVEITDNCNTYIDSISVNYKKPIDVNLGNDTMLCPNQVLTLKATNTNASYRWQDNSTASTYVVSQAGTYWVEVSLNSCTYTDSIRVSYKKVLINTLLGKDTAVCIGTTLVLNGKSPEAKYLWTNGTTLPSLNVNNAGKYWVKVTDECSSIIDTITVDFVNCNCYLFMPNVFTADEDNLNDFFAPVSEAFLPASICKLSDYKFLIFNRWGEKVFETNDYKQGWDGRYKGKLVSSGTYVYKLRYKLDGIPKNLIGTVLLQK